MENIDLIHQNTCIIYANNLLCLYMINAAVRFRIDSDSFHNNLVITIIEWSENNFWSVYYYSYHILHVKFNEFIETGSKNND